MSQLPILNPEKVDGFQSGFINSGGNTWIAILVFISVFALLYRLPKWIADMRLRRAKKKANEISGEQDA